MTIIKLTDNIKFSPFLRTLISSGIGYEKDQDDNIIFNEFQEEELENYITYLNTGICNEYNFNLELYDYMGHETITLSDQDVQLSRIKLEEEWLWNNKDKLGTVDTYMSNVGKTLRVEPIQSYLEGWNYIIIRKPNNQSYIYIRSSNIDTVLDILSKDGYTNFYKNGVYYVRFPRTAHQYYYYIELVDNHLDIIYSQTQDIMSKIYKTGIIYGKNIYRTKRCEYEFDKKLLSFPVEYF